MVLLSAAICTKSGKAVVARQFMEMSRSRVEGLLAAFPKLINVEEQHTFVETDSVRYVYQPLESLYMVLITTKNSNILEDLETLRLFAKVIPEYCRVMSEQEVSKNAFDLIAAFDEIVALGYRENVNLQQIKTYTTMDSHDENVFKMVQKNKEREAREQSKRREKELLMQRKEQQRSGNKSGGFAGGFGSDGRNDNAYGGSMGGGISSQSISSSSSSSSNVAPAASSYSSAQAPAAASSSAAAKKPAGRGMKLGGKPKTNDFVDALIAEGETVAPIETPATRAAAPAAASNNSASNTTTSSPAKTESIHVKIDEKISLTANRDGGLENMEIKGVVFLTCTDPNNAKVRVALDKIVDKKIPFQTHPNVDKKLFTTDSIIGLKDADRAFPVNSEVGVVKWKVQGVDETSIPLTINCWPNTNADGTCDVNVEFELLEERLELNDVVISIPLPASSGAPVIASIDGQYKHDSRRSVLEWQVPVIDNSNKSGALEFRVKAKDADDFFPVLVNFTATRTYAGVQVRGVQTSDTGAGLRFSSETLFSVEKYEIV